MKYFIITILIFLLIACDLFNKDPVEKVSINNETPVEGTYNDKHVGDQQAFSFDSNSELGLPLTEFYRVDGERVDNDNQYTHTFDKKGVTTIEGVAKTKEDSSKVTWIYSVEDVEKVTITNEQPAQGSYTDKHKGETQKFSFDSNSELGLPITEFYRVNNIKVDDDNEYTHTFDKGVTTIEGIAKTKEDSSKVEWVYIVENQSPIATSKSITSDEETTTTIPESELGYDPDGDNLEFSVTNTSGGIDAKFENGNLVIEREQDYFGSAEVNYSLTDGEATATGKVSDEIANTPDNPVANAGEDKTGTINEEINLDGSNSKHPDNPISNITTYLWKALNEEGNITINNNDQANTTLNANTRGQYQIELTVTDDKGATDKDTVNVNINSTIISGLVLDTDTQEINTILLAWVTANGDTAWTNNSGEYQLETTPNDNLEIKAGYKENGQPKSYITTIRNIDANIDIAGLDIAVVTYDNMNTTPEEFYLIMEEANAKDGKLRALMKGMVWYLTKKTDKYGQEFTTAEWNKLKEDVNTTNNYLKNPLPIVEDYSGWFPTTEEETIGKITIVKRLDAGAGSIGVLDYDNDNIVDHVRINLMDPYNLSGSTREETASALVGFDVVRNTSLSGGKTIFYENEAINIITQTDIKAIKMIENLTYEIGGLEPNMSITNLLQIQ